MTHSQYGEDEMVLPLLPEHGCAVEIGAGDGVHLSNTALFRERGWLNILIEPDPHHREGLLQLESDLANVLVRLQSATPENINKLVPRYTDLLSIDVDGDDIFLLDALDDLHRPRIVIVEYNPTMPMHLDVMPARLGLKIGASIPALVRVAHTMGYGIIGVTPCNLVLQRGAHDIDLNLWAPRPDYAVATEYFTGRPLLLGTAPWGVDFENPLSPKDVVIR